MRERASEIYHSIVLNLIERERENASDKEEDTGSEKQHIALISLRHQRYDK